MKYLTPTFLGAALIMCLSSATAEDTNQSMGHLGTWKILPSSPQKLMPYLSGLFTMPENCLQPSLLGETDAISTAAQSIKSAAADIGWHYYMTLTFDYSNITPRVSGMKNNFVSSNNEFWGTWTLAKSADNKQGVFLMLEADWGEGFGYNENDKGVQNSLGSLSNPQSSTRGGDGLFIPNLSLGYSGWDGKFVAMLGTLDLSNFLDQNRYSANWSGNLLNLSFNYNPCLPLFWNNWGYMTAWQPHKNFYTLYATSGSNAEINHNPFQYISSNYWVHVAEMGYINEDVLGYGPGTYRFIYTITREDGELGGGAAINIEQQLGKNNSLGFFTRVGYMDDDAAAVTGVKAAATCGFVLDAPFTSSGWGSQSNNDQVALGFLWQRAAESEKPYTHKDEYGIELSVVIQVTPTFFIQPDVQYIFNPVHASDNQSGAFVFQLETSFRF